MDNITPQVPENTQVPSQERFDRPEQGVQARPEVQAPDVQQEQVPVSQPDHGQATPVPVQPIVSAEPVTADQPVNINSAPEQIDADEDNVIATKDLPWVKRAEKIIDQDKDKPFQEEEDSEKLQQEYLAKKYGVKVEIDDVDKHVK